MTPSSTSNAGPPGGDGWAGFGLTGRMEREQHHDDDAVDLGDGWVEKDGDVEREEIEEILPQAEPTEGQAPLP